MVGGLSAGTVGCGGKGTFIIILIQCVYVNMFRYYSGHMIVQWSAHPPGQWSEFNTHSGQVYLG